MNIGQIAYTYKPVIGGCETYISTLFDLFGKHGHTSRVYQARKDGDDQNDPELELIPAYPLFRRKPVYFYNLFLNLKLKQLMREDLLIVHDPIHYWPVAWKRHTIVISHGVRWVRPEETNSLYNKIHYRSGKFAFDHARKLVANDTDFLRRFDIDIKPKEKAFQQVVKGKWFIPNCVNTAQFSRNDGFSGLKRMNAILVPRNLVPGRGVDIAIRAFKSFSEKHPDMNLIICGDYADPFYRVALFDAIRELDLIGRVFFIGSVHWGSMSSVYSSVQMTVVPTRYEEGTSLAALESMSCGTATLSTNVGGLADLPTRQCDPDADQLAQLMLECYPKRLEIAEEQQREVQHTHNTENFNRAWLEVINAP